MQNNNDIKVSAIMPAYNAGRYIGEAIGSVLRQTHRNLELVVVNDGSTDNTREIVRSINDDRIRYFELDENKGRGYARNVAVGKCSGDVVAICDADDVSLPERFAEQIAFLQNHPDVAVVGTQLLHFSETAKPCEVYHFPEDSEAIKLSFDKGTMGIAHASCMLRKACFAQLRYEESIAYNVEDFELFLRLNESFKMTSLPRALVLYRNELTGLSWQRIMLHELHHHYAIYSAKAKLGGAACADFETWRSNQAGRWKYEQQAALTYCKVKVKQVLRQIKTRLTA